MPAESILDELILAIDCGNSRVKWAWCTPLSRPSDNINWIESGALELEHVASLPEAWRARGHPAAIMVCNVAGEQVAASLSHALGCFKTAPQWIQSGPAGHGVVNGYADPRQLGADRWAALIGARALHAGDCLVVMAGTATTVDVLVSNGEFRGGLILPGVQLMKQALARHTAGLKLAEGNYADMPRNTADAIETGCLVAQAGAIEGMFLRLGTDALCLLSGGAADRIAARLNIPFRVVDNLVLEGLVRMAPWVSTR
jgi:type III pantothenate kinase